MKLRMAFVALGSLLFSAGNIWAAPFTSLYAFGDSLSDAGSSPSAAMSLYKLLDNNCDPTRPCAPIGPYYEGRLSNGPVASEHLASVLFGEGVATTHFRSYAVAGAGTGDENSGFNLGGLIPLPGMKQELDQYISDSSGVADPNALYYVWGGANDYVVQDSPVTAAQNIAGHVSALAQAGASRFLVPNLPDLSQAPVFRDESEASKAEAQAFSVVFNSELATQLGNVSASFPEADIFQFDTYSFLNSVIENPMSYGFTDVEDPCLSAALIPCGNPDAHLYWDDFHPTTRAHAIIASEFASAVPEPQIGAMLIMGLAIVGVASSRRRKRGRGGMGGVC